MNIDDDDDDDDQLISLMCRATMVESLNPKPKNAYLV